jgi:hypothetical protein
MRRVNNVAASSTDLYSTISFGNRLAVIRYFDLGVVNFENKDIDQG